MFLLFHTVCTGQKKLCRSDVFFFFGLSAKIVPSAASWFYALPCCHRCRQLVLRTALLPSLLPSAFYSYAVLIAVLHPRPLSHADQDFLFHPANLHLADTEFLGDLGLRLILVVAQPDQNFFLFGKLVYKLF